MGLTKQYLRYCPTAKFNIIASVECGIKFITYDGQEGRYVAVGACEDIIIWDLRLGEKALVLPGEMREVACLAASPNKITLVAGYEDGTIEIFDIKTGDHLTTFSGHRAPITCLDFDLKGHRLVSGSKDSDIIVWDIVAETGIHRLCGHNNVITQVKFLNAHNIIVSSSKDSLIKFWDLDTAHCFKTIIGHRTEIWGFCLAKDETYLITGCNNNELQVWEIQPQDHTSPVSQQKGADGIIIQESDESCISPISCKKIGAFLREGQGRVTGIVSDTTGKIVACHGVDGKKVELFAVLSYHEAHDRWKQRLKKLRRKQAKQGVEESTAAEVDKKLCLIDEVIRLPTLTCSSKVKSSSVVVGRGGEIRVAVTLKNNSIELFSVTGATKTAQCSTLRTISSQGHRSLPRAVDFSSDNLAIVTTCGSTLKMWNRASQKCLRTVNIGYALSVCFVPGDRHVLVGINSGELLIVDIAAGDVLETIEAHSVELWSICITANQLGCVTGGADKTVKFWDFTLISDPSDESSAKTLSLVHKSVLKLEENVIVVKVSPNNKLVAAALLDCTVKIFFVDTLKFFLSLYGHKLPILCMDISSDSKIIATGSADRNIKIWGLDFGDCHRSLFGHCDSVMGLQFVPKTHYFFSCGKDGKVKQWDGDTFTKILTLNGHHGGAYSLAVSSNGQYVVSTGVDQVIRLYERTLEPLILEDEEEEEREAAENDALVTGEKTFVPGLKELILPSKKTVGSEKYAELLVECLEIGQEYSVQLMDHEELCKSSGKSLPVPTPPALMVAFGAKNAEEYLLGVLKGVRTGDLEESLLLLPFSSVCQLLTLLPPLMDVGSDTELLTKVMNFLLKIHHGPIVGSPSLIPVLKQLQHLSFNKVNELRDIIGINLHGMLFIQRKIEEKEGIELFKSSLIGQTKRDKKNRMKRERKALKITL